PGFDEFLPDESFDTGYSRFSDVVTSMEFERMLSASGPFGGHEVCPSNHQEPKKIAFLQCVGSRDISCGSGYCSSVCCMYAMKEAFIAKDHMKGLDISIFYMDLRAYGKDFDKYCVRAEKEQGVKMKRARVQTIEKDADQKMLVRFSPESGGVQDEQFDLVVLSIGLQPTKELKKLSQNLGLTLNENGFVWTNSSAPLSTSRKGVFVAGVAGGPKDIPETVVQAGAAACEARSLLAAASYSLTKEPVFPVERNVASEAPRVGVFVCHCGINIGGVVHVPAVMEFAKGIPHVAHSEETMYACSQDAQEHIKQVILEHKLNRVVVASCSPRTHEALFQQTLKEAGLNPYLFEMANIRDQCSWIHADYPSEATEKAKTLVRMAVAKTVQAEALTTAMLPVTPSALVIGGGLAGMIAALAIADQGYRVAIVERSNQLGGNLRRLKSALPDANVPVILGDLIDKIEQHKKIAVFTGAQAVSLEGFIGNFESRIGQGKKKSIVKHGVVVVASGGAESLPTEYLYGADARVLTQLELEERLIRPKALSDVKNIVMIQCVGSREEGHQYCSRVCCAMAVKNARIIKKRSPGTEVYILYRDMRTYGFNERYYQEARDAGVLFIRYDTARKPIVSKAGKKLQIRVHEPLLNTEITLEADLLALASRIEPDRSNEALSQLLKVPMNEDRFFLEAHVKLRPVEFATEGVFLAGLAHGPKSMPETIAQALAAAAKATAIISKDVYKAEPTIAAVNDDLCDGCGICVPVCDYNALTVTALEGDKNKKKIVVNEAMCKGCGACVAACPSGAMEQKGFKSSQILAMIKEALAE
ncbi:MAG: FAD-dependent oxidoreductase, partial [Chitinivibrionales bacterium]|nr:FAD-dependent oxidoreductase [Chitinivibrionales bacterium]